MCVPLLHPYVMLTGDRLDRMRRALEDNERVFFHPQDGLIAVWCGGATVNIYDGDTWEEVGMFTQSLAFSDDAELSEVENAVTVRLADRGYIREGRGSGTANPRTQVTER